MKRQKRVFWSRGMLLTEQHFQAQSRFVEDELRFRTMIARSANWGLTELEFDTGALFTSVLKLQRCAGVLPDGIAFDIPETDPLPTPRNFEDVFPANKATLDVYLALSPESDGAKNVSYDSRTFSRFIAEDQNFADQRDGRFERIEVMHHNFSILLGSEGETGPATKLRIGQIARKEGGGFRIKREFIPPCLNIACSSYLSETLLGGLLGELNFVWDNLSSLRGQRSELLADFSDSDYRRFWVLHIVNRAVPELNHFLSHPISSGPKPKNTEFAAPEPEEAQVEFKHLLYTPNVHPEELYLFLLRLAGALCTFSTEHNPFEFPKYNHNDLGASFTTMTEITKRLLTAIVYRPRECVSFPVAPDQGKSWSGLQVDFPETKYLDGKLFLVVRPLDSHLDLDPAHVVAYLKICSEHTVDEISVKALPALAMRHVAPPPPECPRRHKSLFFRIYPQVGSNVWDDVYKNRRIRIIVLPAMAESSYEFFTVLNG